jgi:Uma2 family endonuclease
MAAATLARRAKAEPIIFGRESNGILMTPEEFDRAEFDDAYRFELVNGVLVVSPIPSENEAEPNEELGHLLRTYRDQHPKGKALNGTLQERYVKIGGNRRRPDRCIWASLGRDPIKGEKPNIIAEFVSWSKRDRLRDYETKRDEYEQIQIQEYWIIDRFRKTMTVHVLDDGKYRKRVLTAKQTYRTPLLPGFEVPLARLFTFAEKWVDATEDGMENDA